MRPREAAKAVSLGSDDGGNVPSTARISTSRVGAGQVVAAAFKVALHDTPVGLSAVSRSSIGPPRIARLLKGLPEPIAPVPSTPRPALLGSVTEHAVLMAILVRNGRTDALIVGPTAKVPPAVVASRREAVGRVVVRPFMGQGRTGDVCVRTGNVQVTAAVLSATVLVSVQGHLLNTVPSNASSRVAQLTVYAEGCTRGSSAGTAPGLVAVGRVVVALVVRV